MVRLKSRYFLCEICVPDRDNLAYIKEKVVYYTIKAAVNKAHGDYGAAICNLGLSVKYVNAHTGVVFIRCRKAHYRLLWSALPFITSLENRGPRVSCFFNCLHIGGKMFYWNLLLVLLLYSSSVNAVIRPYVLNEKQEVRKAILSCSIANVRGEEPANGSEDDFEEI
ncbi:hypothetical protein DNTS_027870 [Danionella cerebrum]|uniref:Uncharacterized protein n=1 Tax=Danionella cerebrum TaxID=2873325 RepID=A0A553MQM3_9TELE|nr:hypothetical protein DNTS_027870 [Danionella translucida]